MVKNLLLLSRVTFFLMIVLFCCQCDPAWRMVTDDFDANVINKTENRYKIEHENYDLTFRAFYLSIGPRVALTILSKKDNLTISYGNVMFKSLYYNETYHYPDEISVRIKYQDYSIKIMNFRLFPRKLIVKPKDGEIIFKEKDVKVEFQTSITQPWKGVSRKRLFETQTINEHEQMEIQYRVFGFDSSKLLGYPDYRKSNFMIICDILNDGNPLKIKFKYKDKK